ncbi:hypothetical protein C1146_12570 [Clostridium botulinum]|nr:hypothetical protein C1146_12570 [Clostridium botulinum]
MQDKAIWESNNYVYRGNQGARYLAAGRYNYNGGAWRPALEVLDSDPLISNKKSGDIVKFGTLYINNKKIKRPTDPVSFNGNIIEYNGGNIEIKNTDNDDDYKLQWIYIKDGDKNLLISDRALIKRITWSQLNSQNLVAGKDFNIEGTDYKCRLLTGGNDGEGSSHFGDKGALDLDNEWDRYISMEYWMKFIDKFYNTSSIKKYGSWANTYYGKRRIDGNYGGFDANSKKTFAFNNIIDESEIKSKYIFSNGRIVVIDNYGMVSDYKNFTDTQPTTVPIDGTKIKNMFLGYIEDIGLVPMMEKDDEYIWYIDNDNKERMLPIEKSEFNDTIVYHKKNNESDKFLFIKNDGKLTYFDKNRFEKETAINMNDVEKVLPSTNVTDDLFLMKDGTIKTLMAHK